MSDNIIQGTPHINATPADFAKTVLLPGDPLRSKYIAENYIDNPTLINNVRGVQGYTGTYKNVPVTVMASGMGMPSMGIYSYELYTEFDVENIIRIGSIGGIADNVALRDIVIAMGCSTNSNFASQYNLPGTLAPLANYELLETTVNICRNKGANYHVGNIITSDVFYNDNKDFNLQWKRMGILGVEMEAAALYYTATLLNKKALAICTVSDHVIREEYLSAADRQESFTEMMEIALETVVSIHNQSK